MTRYETIKIDVGDIKDNFSSVKDKAMDHSMVHDRSTVFFQSKISGGFYHADDNGHCNKIYDSIPAINSQDYSVKPSNHFLSFVDPADLSLNMVDLTGYVSAVLSLIFHVDDNLPLFNNYPRNDSVFDDKLGTVRKWRKDILDAIAEDSRISSSDALYSLHCIAFKLSNLVKSNYKLSTPHTPIGSLGFLNMYHKFFINNGHVPDPKDLTPNILSLSLTAHSIFGAGNLSDGDNYAKNKDLITFEDLSLIPLTLLCQNNTMYVCVDDKINHVDKNTIVDISDTCLEYVEDIIIRAFNLSSKMPEIFPKPDGDVLNHKKAA